MTGFFENGMQSLRMNYYALCPVTPLPNNLNLAILIDKGEQNNTCLQLVRKCKEECLLSEKITKKSRGKFEEESRFLLLLYL